MIKYNIYKDTAEVTEYYKYCVLDQSVQEPSLLGSYTTAEEALAALRAYHSTADRYGRILRVTEVYVQKYEDGTGGDILGVAPNKDVYHIDYHTGAGNFIYAESLYEAMKEADEHINYTQCKVSILNDEYEEVAFREWYGVEAEDEDGIISYGSFGYYTDWIEL